MKPKPKTRRKTVARSSPATNRLRDLALRACLVASVDRCRQHPREQARKAMPQLLESLADVPQEECECEEAEWIDGRHDEMADGLSSVDE